MKRLILLFVLLPQIVLAHYYDVEIGGIYYDLNTTSGEAMVIGSTQGSQSYLPITLVSYAGDVVIPETVVYNGSSFRVTSIEGETGTGTAPNSYGAFSNCKDLVSITIPKSIVHIGQSAFNGCTSLNAVYISDLSSWCRIFFDNSGLISNPLFYAHSLYLNGNKIVDLVIPDDISTINEGTFSGCDIETVIAPKHVKDIGYSSFKSCSKIRDLFVYGPELNIGFDETFSNPKDITLHIRERYKDNFGSFTLNAFKNVEYIQGVDFNLIYIVDGTEYKSYVMEVGEGITPEAEPTRDGYIFSGWSTIPETMPDHNVTITGTFSPNTYKLTYVVDGNEYKVFNINCGEAITPEHNPVRKGMTFSGWSNIPETMPAKDVTITGTFSWSKIVNDNVVYQVTDTINNYSAVIGNENASSMITIAPNIDFDYNYKVTSIVDNAFNGCKGITSIDIPATITNIGVRTFAGIDKLTDVTIYAENVPETDRTAFENSYVDYVTLHVPYGSVEKYKSVGPWKDFKEIVAIEGTEPISVETCVMPTISYLDGKLEFESETYGAECHYEIKVEDAKEGVGPEVTLSSAYEISAYASKEGYNDSEKNTATLYWINVDPTTTGVIDSEMRINTNSILVQNTGGVIAISGVADGDNVLIYNISGQLIAQGKASGNHVEISTNLSCGDICIIKIGDKSVKYLLK